MLQRIHNLGCIGIAGMLVGVSAHADPLFGHAEYPVGQEPRSLAVADFNGDTWLDVAVGIQGTDTVAVLLNRGNGLFEAPDLYRAGSDPRYIEAADMDLDGHTDLVAAGYSSRTITVLMNDGGGTFSDLDSGALSLATEGQVTDMVVGPIDSDDYPDVLVSTATSNEFFASDGFGSLDAGSTIAGSGLGLDLADLDGDGDQDFVVGTFSLSSYRNDGDAGFTLIDTFDVDPASSSHPNITLDDLDGDGHPDVAAGNFSGSTVGVAFNDGSGGFSGARQFAVESKPTQVAVTDLDEDGNQDLAIANSGADSVSILLGDGTGTFTEGSTSPVVVADRPYAAAFSDFNADGKMDLAVTGDKCLEGELSCEGGQLGIVLGKEGGLLDTDRIVPIEGDREPRSLDDADMDRDGDSDLVIVSWSGDRSTVALNRGANLEKGSIVDFRIPNPTRTGEIILADVTGRDGPDLIGASSRVPEFFINRNNGGGALLEPEYGVPDSSRPAALATADFHGDGFLDLAIAGHFDDQSKLSIHSNDGEGRFAGMPEQPEPAERVIADWVRSLASADLTGDGNPDLLSAHENDEVLLFANNGDGSFDDAESFGVPGSPTAIAVADFDGDGITEVALTDAANDEVVVLENDGAGNFSIHTRIGVGFGPFGLTVGDLDGDGHPDLVTANQDRASENATVLLNDGSGSFDKAGSFHARTGPVGLALEWAGDPVTLADLDDDGDLDIAMVNPGSHNVSVMYNRGILRGTTSAAVPASGTVTSDSGDGATWSKPVVTTVTSPNAGTVTIVEDSRDGEAPGAFEFLGQQIDIEAPSATISDPLVIAFRFDSSHIPTGTSPGSIRVFREGTVLAGCADPSSAVPDPCVASRDLLGDGDVEITVRVSDASAWNLGRQLPIDLTVELELDTPSGPAELSFPIPQWKIDLLLESITASQENKDRVPARMDSFPPVKTNSELLGEVTLGLRSPNHPPFKESTGQFEEESNQFPFLPEFAPYQSGGLAVASFDAYFELGIPDHGLLYNESAIVLSGALDKGWPPDSLESLSSESDVPLTDESGNTSAFTITSFSVERERIPRAVIRLFRDRFENRSSQ